MDPIELAECCNTQLKMGLKSIILTMPMPKNGLRGHRVRTPFGLAEIASVNNGKVVFWIEINKIRTWLGKLIPKIREPK